MHLQLKKKIFDQHITKDARNKVREYIKLMNATSTFRDQKIPGSHRTFHGFVTITSI